MREAPRKPGYDAVVVGAGVIGLTCGWRARQRGLEVLVVERDRPAAGASGVAAGMLAPITEVDFGHEPVVRLLTEGMRAWPEFDAELREASGLETWYERSGALVV